MMAYKFEVDYVRRLLAGDGETERHFTTHFGRLLRIKVGGRWHGRSAQQVEDAIQETFVRVLAALRADRLDDPERIGAFVNRVCENVLHEQYRAAARFVPLPAGAEPPASDDPEEQVASQQGMAIAAEMLAELPPRDREVLGLVLVQEVDKDEVCRRFGVTRDHLRVILHRARERFRVLADQRRQARLAARSQ
jgi:RNA polymerase sigma-70 factor (ECF subfamily)